MPGLIERGGEVAIKMLPNVQQQTIKPMSIETMRSNSSVYTDEYNIYNRPGQWGYTRKTVNHSKGVRSRQ